MGRARFFPALLLAGAVPIAGLTGCGDREPPEDPAPMSVTGALSGEDQVAGLTRVEGPEPLVFPRDHGPHPGYRHEWWYVTGHLFDGEDRHYGFQATLFRFNVAPESTPERPSAWATDQLWMGHFAITDTQGEAFHHFERLSRGALELAGGQPDPFRIWLEDWSLAADDDSPGPFPMRVRFQQDGFGVDLRLEAEKPMVLQGDGGYSQKGPERGNASRYFSWTRLAAEGRLTLEGDERRVAGQAWKDREWGTSALGEDLAGWDWFSVQLDDGHELMFYHLRREDGGVDPISKGLWVTPAGDSRVLGLEDVDLVATDEWQSPDGQATYPGGWQLTLPEEGLALELRPVVADQELRAGVFRYWEGALAVSGERAGQPVSGHGYAELTGY